MIKYFKNNFTSKKFTNIGIEKGKKSFLPWFLHREPFERASPTWHDAP